MTTRSTSGASLAVIKTAPEGPARRRLLAQAEWLKSFNDDGIVEVLETREDGYVMPYLHEPKWPLPSQRAVAYAVLEILNTAVWNRPPQLGDFGEREWTFEQYLGRIDKTGLLSEWWAEYDTSGEQLIFKPCDTHGDPTLENVLYDDQDTPVLVDPIPDAVIDGKMPALRAVDLGKVLQSALGYELIKRGLQEQFHWEEDIHYPVLEYCRSDAEYDLAKFFCAVHVARFIPYQTPYLVDYWSGAFETIVKCLKVFG